MQLQPLLAGHVREICLLGSGHTVPATRLDSSELDQRLGLAPGTVQARSGVIQRAVAGPQDTAASLAASAARQAMQAAGLDFAELDCVVAASGTQDQGMPCNAALVHRELGLSSSGIPA